MKTKNIESLESIVDRVALPFVALGGVEDHYGFSNALLAEPSILNHIPAVKALREEVERLRAGFHAELSSIEAGANKIIDERIAELRDEIESLRQGGEGNCPAGLQMHFAATEEGAACPFCEAPQPAIQPGYAAAVTLLTEAYQFGQFSDDFDYPLAKPIRKAVRDVCSMLVTAQTASKCDAEVLEDAERYRWLRNRAQYAGGTRPVVWLTQSNEGDVPDTLITWLDYEDLDEEIDRARGIKKED